VTPEEQQFQGPLNRPPIDPVYEDEPNSPEHSAEAQYRTDSNYFTERPAEKHFEEKPRSPKREPVSDQFKSEHAYADYQT